MLLQLLGLAADDALSSILDWAALGTLLGTAVAVWHREDEGIDVWTTTACGTLAGGCVGVLIAYAEALGLVG